MNLTLNKVIMIFVVLFTTFTSSFSQTEIIKSIEQYKFKEKRIIGIGESTHNSHQEQTFSYNLIKELVQSYGFNTLLIEAPSVSAEVLNTYINNVDTTNLKRILFNTQYLFFNWKTNEFAQLLDWLREYNKTAFTKTQIIGIQKIPAPLNEVTLREYSNHRDSLMAINIIDILNSITNSKAVVLAHNAHISNNQMNLDKIKPMGYYLKQFYKDNYFSIGQLFGKGSFNTHIVTNFYNLETTYVKKDISKLSKKLDYYDKNRIINTDENKLLNRKRKIWFYGSYIHKVGQQSYSKEKISNMFDAIIFHDSIYAASNLLINGNYFAKAVHVKNLNNTINEQKIHYKLDYNSTCNSILEIQFYKGNKFVQSIVDTLYYNLNQSVKTINIGSKFNTIRANLYLFEDGKIAINHFMVSDEQNKIILSNLFQLNNNKELPLEKNSAIKLNTKYKDEQFEMYRYTDKKEN